MKTFKIASFFLAVALLVCSIPFSVSAASTVNFIPKIANGKIYGAPVGSSVADLKHIYFDSDVEVYDNNKNRLGTTSKICTGYTVKINGASYTSIVMGDVDGDGKLEPYDYVAVKRAYFDTLTISTYGKEATTCAASEELRPIHYIKVKRAYFGTYDINNEYTCDPYDPDAGESGWSPGWV